MHALKTGAVLLNVGTFRQTNEYSCGPAAIKIILDSFGEKVSFAELVHRAKTTKHDGTCPENLEKAVNSLGYATFVQMNADIGDIERFLNGGLPVIVNYQSPYDEYQLRALISGKKKYDDGHYAVVRGMNKKQLFLSDPAHEGGYNEVDKSVFVKLWYDKENNGNVFERWLMIIFPEKIPFVKVEGDNRDIGEGIGEKCKREIGALVETVAQDYKSGVKHNFSSWVNRSRMFLPYCKKEFPEYIQELEGIARGAGVDFDALFSLNCREELRGARQSSHLGENGSSVVAQVNAGIVLAHNEDYTMIPNNSLYVVQVKQKKKQSFLSVGHVGCLPGSIAGLSRAGIAIAGNSVNANYCRYGVAKNCVQRAILDEDNVWSAAHRVRSANRAIGRNFIIISPHEGIFVETTAKREVIIPIIGLPAVSTNHYTCEELRGNERCVSESSRLRYALLEQLVSREELTNMKTIKKILKDHEQFPRSICRHEYESKRSIKMPYTTLASIILNPERGVLYVTQGNPCKRKYQRFCLD